MARRLGGLLIVTAIAVSGCGSVPVGGGPHSATGQTGSIWANGVMLPAGYRVALAADDAGWILTKPFQDDTLQLSKVSPADGSILMTATVDTNVQGFSGAGLASDGASHIWISYGQRIMRFDEASASVTVWSLPVVAPSISTANPLAGYAQADGWDAKSGDLLFVRNDDQHLYGFDSSTGAFTTLSDLPITTSSISRMAIAADGEVAITGTLAGAATFTPTAVRLAALDSKPELLTSVVAACTRSPGLMFLSSTGLISVGASSPLATIPAPQSTQVPFACDDNGNVFEATVGSGIATVIRVSSTGVVATATDPLIQRTANGIGGPVATYSNPGVVALIPDGQGSAWLVSEVGTQASTKTASAYPSLAHVVFATQ